MKKLLFLAFLLSFSMIACKSDVQKPNTTSVCDKLQGDDYLVFGTVYGFCKGNCTHLFKLTTSDLYEDDFDNFQNSQQPTFKKTPLSAAKLDVGKSVCTAFPDELLKEKESRIGCPDCHDQGSIYVEIKKNGVVQAWFIDPDQTSTVPQKFQDFAKIVSEAVEKLEQ